MNLTALSLLILSCTFTSAQQIEVSAHRKPYTKDATVGYVSTPDEAKFVEKKPDSDVGGGQTFYCSSEAGSLLGKRDKLISWFGIVRILPTKEGDTFLVEHKHYDGMNDYHIQLASLFGLGDFKVAAKDTKGAIKPLSLVRVIGTVVDEAGGIPTVKADYIRVWHLGDFAFMDYGVDATNERWKKLRKVVGMIYTPTPDDAYYESLLGKLPAGDKGGAQGASGCDKPAKSTDSSR